MSVKREAWRNLSLCAWLSLEHSSWGPLQDPTISPCKQRNGHSGRLYATSAAVRSLLLRDKESQTSEIFGQNAMIFLLITSNFVCVMFMSTCVCTHLYICMYVWRPEPSLVIFPQESNTFLLRQGLFLAWSLPSRLERLVREHQESPCLYFLREYQSIQLCKCGFWLGLKANPLPTKLQT